MPAGLCLQALYPVFYLPQVLLTLGTMYSGSAVFDKDNTSGFGTKKNPPLVYAYMRLHHFPQQVRIFLFPFFLCRLSGDKRITAVSVSYSFASGSAAACQANPRRPVCAFMCVPERFQPFRYRCRLHSRLMSFARSATFSALCRSLLCIPFLLRPAVNGFCM